jgi:hypothetical protein
MTTETDDERACQHGGIVTFRASKELIASIEAAAAAEGISKSDIVRRAAIRDLAGKLEVAAQ